MGVVFAPPANSCVDSLNAKFDNLSKASLCIVHRILSLVVARFGIDKTNQYPPILTEFYRFKQMKNYPYERPKIVVGEMCKKTDCHLQYRGRQIF